MSILTARVSRRRLTACPFLTHPVPVPKAPFLEIKLRPTVEQKRLFEAASEAFKPPLSLNQWLLLAGETLARSQGVELPETKKRGAK